MLKRCIMVFPKFENGEMIDRIREKYDPHANLVKPHVTLVFPFDSDIAAGDLKEHISSVVSGTSSFELVLNGITPVHSGGKYLFLNLVKGKDEMIDLHKRLYTGILENYVPEWPEGQDFLPHMTVGSFEKEHDFEVAIHDTKDISDVFKTIVSEVAVEIIGQNEESIIELVIPFES